MIPTLTDLILGMCCSLVFTTIHTAIKNRKERRSRESRERQAKLEAFWKEEQLRLNPRAVLVDRLPPIEKYSEWGEWDVCEQLLAQAEMNLTRSVGE